MASGRYSSIATGIVALASALYMAGCATLNVNTQGRDDDIPMNHAYLFPAGMECVGESHMVINGSFPVASGIRENVFYSIGLPKITVNAFYERKGRAWIQNPIEIRVTEESTTLNDLGERVRKTHVNILRDNDGDGIIDDESSASCIDPFSQRKR